MSYVRAVVWVVARLAEGLEHAHQRGVLHRDIKPSNILLSADGQPMLLDFNLAQRVHADPASAMLGGTVAYMAPEHLRALARQETVQARAVDARADVYSLGMVLFEMLTGARPFEQSASYTPLPLLIEAMAVERSAKVPSLRAVRADVPWGLESVLRKCLDPDPARRYQRAEHLAEDLRRLLEDRPLLHAPELSRLERLQKWARRHPRLTSVSAVATAAMLLLTLCGFALAGTRGRLVTAEDRLEAKQARDRLRDHDAGTLRSLLLVNTTTDRPHEHLRQGLRSCEDTLAIYGVLNGQRLEHHQDWARLDEAERRRIAEQTQELLLLLAGARVRLTPGDREVLRQALSLLDAAEALPGLPPSRALGEERAAYLDALGEQAKAQTAREQAETVKPASARDFYLLARADARRGRYAKAIARLDEALRREPQHYWSWVQRGICHQERKEHDLAAADFSVCIGLWPDFAWGHFNRASALDHCGHREEAIRGYSEALRLDPAFVLARLNRGLARLELGQDREALADFDQAAAQGRDNAFIHSGRGVALERLGRHDEADRAFAEASRRARTLPRAQRLRIRWVHGFAVALRLPTEARAAFDEVLRAVPAHPQALYGCAMLLDHAGKTEEALTFYNRALQASPGFVEPRRFRALLHARRGNAAEAVKDINACLEREPAGGATLYAAACVTALLAKWQEQPSQAKTLTEQSLAFLSRAFARGYGRDRAARDKDLAGLHGNPEFRRLLAEK
ncbi:MAG TPA: tetratricopeptide repeat protein [Gemmataceae bacterium]|nr:tetratricopeptide repeat protein [Gemmataceae bacterium]